MPLLKKTSQSKSIREKLLKTFYFPVLVGIILGWLFYGLLVSYSYSSLTNRLRTVKVFDKIVERDPAFYALINDSKFVIAPKDKDQLDEVEWRLLTDLGVLTTTTTTDDISTGIKQRLDTVFKSDRTNLSSITFLDLFIETLDLNFNNQPPGESQNKTLKQYIADCIARKPQSSYYLKEYNNQTDRLNDTAKTKSTIYQYFIPRAVNESVWGGDINLNNILGILYAKNNFYDHYKNLPDTVANVTVDYYEDYRQIRDFHQRLLMSLNDVPEVLHAKNFIFYVEGPEQLCMFILTTIALLLLLQRIFIVRNFFGFSNVDPSFKKNIKRWFRWITISLPLFGFIGTKRGLSQALTQSDSIIRAGSEINQAMTMNNVTYSLGIAFTTTLVALILSLILNFFDNVVKGYEDDFEID